ncbi:MAG: hypothetical protein R6V10_06005 [bacterium]
MKARLALATVYMLLGSFLLCGCDDINEPMQNPVLKPQKGGEQAKEEEKITLLKMKQYFNFVVNVRQELRNYANQVNLAKEQGRAAYTRKLNRFEIKQDQWVRKLKVRQEMLENASKPDDPDHPAYGLIQAMRLLKREGNLYYHSFKYGGSFDPSVDKKLLDALDQVRHQLQKLEEEEKGKKKKE